jgi:hypothetical protein
MQSHHYLAIILAFIAGYVLAAYFPQPGQAIGLPLTTGASS